MVILMVNSELKTFALPFPNERGERKIWVYIPSHSEDEKLPVIYMTDGQNLFDEESTEYGVGMLFLLLKMSRITRDFQPL